MALVTDSWLADGLLLTLALLTLLYWYMNDTADYFKVRGIPCVRHLPVVGVVSALKSFKGESIKALYNQFEGERFFGIFVTKVPVLFVRDPDLVQRTMVKDFVHFYDHPSPRVSNDPTSQNLFNLRSRTWRALRKKITPTFSSGKLKLMFSEINKCGDHIAEEAGKSELCGESVDARLFTNGFATEVIGSTAFGLDFNKANPKVTEFNGKVADLISSIFRQGLTFVLSLVAPKVAELLRFTIFPKHVTDYFVKLTKSTKEYRKRNFVKRNDYFQLLLELQEDEESGMRLVTENNEEDALTNQMQFAQQDNDVEYGVLTDEVMTAQAIIFLLAGTESVSGTMSFMLYHLAKDETVQERLAEEVDRVLAKHGGCYSYQAVKEMTYLDQVIQETQRMYPVMPFIMRECTIPYPVPDSDIVLDKGTYVVIPVIGLHMDPKFYPSPELFNPDRFVDNNHKPNSTFMPFGDGPRICIALRFALLEMKVCISKIVSQYSVGLDSKTKEPFTFEKNSLFPRPVGGMWINFKKRPKQQTILN